MNDTREAFEKWAKDKGFKTDRLKLSNSYTGISTEYAWQAWQAAQAALAQQAKQEPVFDCAYCHGIAKHKINEPCTYAGASVGYTSPPNQEAEIFELKARVKELEGCLLKLKNPKLWKNYGKGGQDRYAGLPPAIRIVDQALANTKKGE